MLTRIHHHLLGLCQGWKSFIADNQQMNAFCTGDERVWSWRRTRLPLEINTFAAREERVYHWRRRRLALERKRLTLEMNAFSVKYCPWNIVLVQLNCCYRCRNILTAIWLVFIVIVQGKSDLHCIWYRSKMYLVLERAPTDRLRSFRRRHVRYSTSLLKYWIM